MAGRWELLSTAGESSTHMKIGGSVLGRESSGIPAIPTTSTSNESLPMMALGTLCESQ